MLIFHTRRGDFCIWCNLCENGFVYATQRNRFFAGDIVEILAAHSYKKLVQGLITRGMDTNSQGVVILNTNKNGETTVHVALKTFDEQEGEDHKFTPKEFLEIVKNAGEEIVKKNPEQREAVDRLYAKLAERFEDFKKNDV